jgi:calcineurin-like phosphoesterase family protein
VLFWRKYPEFGLIMSHVPLHEGGLYSSTDFSKHLLNVHGHIHSMESPEGPYRNVCVEVVNYVPVNIEELRTT